MQFLNAAPLSLSSACLAAASAPAPVIVIFHLTNMYACEKSYKLDLSIVVLNLMLLPVYIPLDSSFISIQFLVLNLDVDLMHWVQLRYLTDSLFFGIPSLYITRQVASAVF